ncbi:MAG: hypothetical protein ACYC0F_19175, partial [Rhodanobacter sp.]
MSYRGYSVSNGFLVDPSGNGDFTTIGAANTAATSGQRIVLSPATYTENVTLKDGVDIIGLSGDDVLPSVKILGKLSASFSGTCTISNVCLQTNGDNLLSLTGSNDTNVYLKNCFLDCSDFDGISSTGSNAAANIEMMSCNGDLGTTGIKLYNVSNGVLVGRFCNFTNTGGSTTASTNSGSSSVSFETCYLRCPLASSGTASLSCFYTNNDCSGLNTTCLDFSGTGVNIVTYSRLSSGTATPITIAASVSVTVTKTVLNSSNATAISSSGTLTYADISQG